MTFMDEENTEHPRDDDLDEEIDESPAPDPEEKERPQPEDVPTAD
jgi:hypothetical protein